MNNIFTRIILQHYNNELEIIGETVVLEREFYINTDIEKFESDIHELIMINKGDGFNHEILIADNRYDSQITLFVGEPDEKIDINYLLNYLKAFPNVIESELDIEELRHPTFYLSVPYLNIEDYYKINKELMDLGYENRVVTRKINRYERGANDFYESFIIGFYEIMMAGLTYDFIKNYLISNFEKFNWLDSIEETSLDIKKLKNEIAEITGESSNLLMLKSFENKGDYIELIFKNRYQEIIVLVDKNSKIINCRLERKTLTNI